VKEAGKLSFLINWEERRIKKEIILKVYGILKVVNRGRRN
jgi:hypothetical protein